MAADGRTVSASMRTGPWLNAPRAGSAGGPVGGALGVLVDNVLGYAIMLDRPAGHWSVSSEISIDLCGPVPMDGSALLAEGSVTHSDSRGGISSGSVVDERGGLVAVCRQQGRWIRTLPAASPGSDSAGPAQGTDRRDLLELLDAQVKSTDGGAELELVATPELVNPLGNLHGGIGLCASDVAAHAALEAAGGPPSDTASVHIAYVRPVPRNTAVRFRASVEHAGRSFAVVRVTSVNENGRPCTIATVTTGVRT
ncbi:PaaI family thioesterase (plasmid) [Streptomyces sp. BH-SS-21]|uniref:PaaI family thioesterase n=1 Tax=Streptomyces liliiviolaceus TaxID=2823109 RepID=A0A941BJ50_9ACTN|nr:PaaI family thioesterase [Streptomyces liliiviolaceus]MBQ0855614.1 PaaI family thioesterase [Streptomyces liliiviolaceus]